MSQGFISGQTVAYPLFVSLGGTGQSSSTGTGITVLQTAPTITLPLIVGVTTNSNAAAGSVGEYIENSLAVGSAISLTSTTPANIISISLTAGDWDVRGIIGFSLVTSSTVITYLEGCSTSTSATISTNHTTSFPMATGGSTVVGNNFLLPIPFQRFSLASTTTIYLVVQASFSANTCSGYGSINARRIR